MLSPEQYLHDAGTQYRPESDLIIGIPVAAHQEGNPRILRTVRTILELSDQSLARDPALFLYLNYPPESAPPAENIRELDDQLGSLALGSRTAVIPLIDPRGANATIGAMRKRLWDAALAKYTNDDIVCMSTDIDLLAFRCLFLPDSDTESPNPFSLLVSEFKREGIDSVISAYRDARLIDDLEQIHGLSTDEELKIRLASILLGLSNYNMYSMDAEANSSFSGRAYRSVEGVDPRLTDGEMIDLNRRVLTKHPNNRVFDVPVLTKMSPRRRAWRILSGWYGNEWDESLGQFSQNDSYRRDSELKELYMSLAEVANNSPVNFISGLVDGLDLYYSDAFLEFEGLCTGPATDSYEEKKLLFLNHNQIMQVYLLDWLVGSDLDKHSDVRFDDKIKTLYTFLPITRREALDIMECLKAIQKGYDDDSISDNLRGLLSTILDRTLKKITGSES